jgi:hypothetical protein
MTSKVVGKAVLWLCVWGFVLPQLNVFAAEVSTGHGGTISGFAKFEGQLPKLPPLEIVKAKDVCKDVPNETLVVGPERGIRYAVVTLEGVPASEAAEGEAVHELDNAGCRFVPHVQAMQVNQSLVLKNTDPILHSVHAFFQGAQPQFNVGLFPGKVVRKPMVSPGVVKLLCEVHSWMSAYVIVTENSYHAVTDVHGEYQIGDVPPGTYRLKVWHERLGTQEKKVEVKAGATSKVDFVLSPSEGAGR